MIFFSRLSPVAFLLVALLTGCSRSVNYYLENGKKHYGRGDFAEALINYRKALQKKPSDADLYYRAALAELKLNKGSDAYQDLNQAVRLDPQHQGARAELENLALTSYLGDAQRPKALYDLLVKLSQKWLAENPNSPEGLRIKGYLTMTDRRPEEAADLFLRAYKSNPNEVKIALGLIDALYQSKQSAAAEKTGLDFIARNRTAGDVYDALYRLYFATNRPADAENILIRKVNDNPKENGYILQLAAHYSRTGNKEQMTAALQKFVANPGGSARVHLDAGDFYASLADWPSALEQYNAGSAVAEGKEKILYQDRIARALLSENKREDGLKVLNAVLAQRPDDQEAGTLRAALLVSTKAFGKADQGIQDFQALVDKNPDDIFLRFVASKARLERGDLSGARVQLLEIVHRSPHFLEAQVMLADIAFNQGNMTEAVQFSEAALEVDPNNRRARMLRGSALRRSGNFDAAAAILDGLAREIPESMEVRLELAYLTLDKGKFAEAEAAFKRILAEKPKEWRAVSGLVDTDLARDHQEQAFARLEEELKLSGGARPVRYILASTALRSGKYNLAIDNLRQLADGSSGSIDAHVRLAEVYRLKGDLRNAIATLQKAAILQPNDPRPGALLPFLLEKENRRQEAKAVARAALAKHPDDADAMNNLAFLLAETGDSLDQASKLARQAVRKQPDNAAFSDTLGYVYLKRDQNNDALEIFGRLIRKYPDDPTCAYHLGMAWYQKGDMEKARTNLAHALDQRPPDELEPEIKDLLKRVRN